MSHNAKVIHSPHYAADVQVGSLCFSNGAKFSRLTEPPDVSWSNVESDVGHAGILVLCCQAVTSTIDSQRRREIRMTLLMNQVPGTT